MRGVWEGCGGGGNMRKDMYMDVTRSVIVDVIMAMAYGPQNMLT